MVRCRLAGAALLLAALALSGCAVDRRAERGDTAPAMATVVIGVDLPFVSGSAMEATNDTLKAMNLYLERMGGAAGRYRVELIKYDNSPDPRASWDGSECVRNANNHVANSHEVAVIGTFFGGCSKVQMPILNAAADGPMLMISHTDNAPGLTKTWDPGEPAKYFPSGMRSYGRVVTTDDRQGTAAARFAVEDLGVKRCFVIHDGTTYGTGVARPFANEARRLGITVVGEAAWRWEAGNYPGVSNRELFADAKAARVDCVFFGGVFDANGGQLTIDKAATIGDNGAVKLIAPDGFTGYPEFLKLPGSVGAYLTSTDLPLESLTAAGGVSAEFLAAYRARFGRNPTSADALYGVQALQIVLAAIEKSDGTRRGVRDQVFAGAGITIGGDRAIIGKPISIDPATGDATVNDVTILQVSDGREVVVKTLSL